MNLERRWTELSSKADLDAEKGWALLAHHYGEAGRHWHTLSHIEDCLTVFDSIEIIPDNATNIEFALFFHDIIYDTHQSDNEERSAEVALSFLSCFDGKKEIADLILATKHSHTEPRNNDEKLIVDIDLSILGSSPDRYTEYSRAIRQEYQWVPESDYRKGRTRLLRLFLDRPKIYNTSFFQHQFESQARNNIASEIACLS